jgi:hypothetical protein
VISDVSKSDGPVDPMTELAGEAVKAIEQSPLSDGAEKGLILLARPVPGVSSAGKKMIGGCASFGFDTEDEAIDFLLTHVAAMCKAVGRSFQVLNVGQN